MVANATAVRRGGSVAVRCAACLLNLMTVPCARARVPTHTLVGSCSRAPLLAAPPSCPEETEAEPVVEKRLVYRLVSGLQASINTHIAMRYPFHDDERQLPVTLQTWRGAGVSDELFWGGHRALFQQRPAGAGSRGRWEEFRFWHPRGCRLVPRLVPGPHGPSVGRVQVCAGAGAWRCDRCRSGEGTRAYRTRSVPPAFLAVIGSRQRLTATPRAFCNTPPFRQHVPTGWASTHSGCGTCTSRSR